MLDINENDLKLLKMKEKLLEFTNVNQEENLADYERLAKQIDIDYYNSIINRIKESNYHNQTLEEELVFLEELEKEYEQLNELQHKFRNIYEKHSFSSLNLSDITNIDIDAIRDRKNIISGYLINLKNIKDNEEKLEEYNEELIAEEKKKKIIEERLGSLEDELKQSFLNSEGRVYSKENASFEYISVVNEYKKSDINVIELLDNTDLLLDLLKQMINYRNEKEEVLSTALICYNNIPNKENKEILDSIRVDTIQARYRLSLFKILYLISKKENGFDKVVKKRSELSDLIGRRYEYLEQLGVRFQFDTFRGVILKLEEQDNKLEELGDNSKVITRIRNGMVDVSEKLEDIRVKNSEFLGKINDKIEIIKDNFSMSSIDISTVSDGLFVEEEKTDDVLTNSVDIADNQVVNIKTLSKYFNLKRATEKTDGVIKRVIEMVSDNHEETNEEIVPELMVENVSQVNYDNSENVNNEDIYLKDDVSLFENLNVTNSFEEKDEEVLDDNTFSDEDYLNANIDEVNTEKTLSNVKDSKNEIDDSLIFQEVTPFENTKLFDDKYDEEVEETLSFNDEMPEAFWVTQNDDDSEIEEEVMSFDEQIDMLLSNNDDAKVKKLVA